MTTLSSALEHLQHMRTKANNVNAMLRRTTDRNKRKGIEDPDAFVIARTKVFDVQDAIDDALKAVVHAQ